MIKSARLIVLLCGLFPLTNLFAQDQLKALTDKIEAAHKQLPVEKVHLHFDKPYYSIGDTIWFKAYIVNADQNEFSRLSTILYADLINEGNVVEHTLRLPVALGTAYGNFVLADSLTEGNYRVRAYTQWMRNFDQEYFFDKTIAVGDGLMSRMLAKSEFTFVKQGEKQAVTADITYTALDNTPLTGKDVSYTIDINNKTVDRGKGVTDANGALKISFVADKPALLPSGVINTSIKVNEKKAVNKIINIGSAADSVSIQFFPEGGQLVNGLPSKVALKALNTRGLGVEVSGYIADQQNTKAAIFKSEYAGMGSFLFVPQPGSTYRAVLVNADGTEKTIAFPKAMEKGYVLSLSQPDQNNVRVRIMASQEILKENTEIILVAQSNNNIWYTAKTILKSEALSTTITNDRFPEGVVQFTLFNKSMFPVAERLVFISHPQEHLDLKLATDQPSYTARQKVKMDVDLGSPASGSLSLAVTDVAKVPVEEEAETTIFTSLLLRSDLRGYLEKPNYYFTGAPDPQKIRQLDNLMLSQGWRRFEWKEIMKDNPPKPVFAAEKGINISGRMFVGSTKKPVAKGSLMLLLPGTGNLPLDTLTDENGRFSFDNLIFADSARFVIQARNAKDRSNVTTEIDKVAEMPAPLIRDEPDAIDGSSFITYLKSSSQQFDEKVKYGMLKKSDIELKEVSITAKKTVNGNREIVENSSNMMPGHYDYLVKAKDFRTFSDAGDAIYAKVPGLAIRYNPGPPPTTTLSSGRTPFKGAMHVFVDGVDLGTDIGPGTIIPSDIAAVEVMVGGATVAIYGGSGVFGILLITTKRGNFKEEMDTVAPGIRTITQKGYTVARQFYSPVYTPDKKSAMPDLRSTIYWNPEVIADKDGKASVEFFTADNPGTYRAVIEGIDTTGKLGREVITYTVK